MSTRKFYRRTWEHDGLLEASVSAVIGNNKKKNRQSGLLSGFKTKSIVDRKAESGYQD